MCKAATCDTCSKKTWYGCGLHIPSVLDHVPKEEWCKCEPTVDKDGTKYPPMGSLMGGVKATFGW